MTAVVIVRPMNAGIVVEDAAEPVPVVGSVPPGLAERLKQVAPPQIPPLCRLPRPGERDPITGSSRSWLIETNAKLPPAARFLFRVKQKGKMRGTVFCNVAKLLQFLQNAEAAEAASASAA